MALHPMKRHGANSPTDVGGGSSSIALLQERFRQLQKMREKREEMELLKLFSGSETVTQTRSYEPPAKMLVHPEITTTRPSFQDSFSLGLNLYKPQTAKTPPFTDFWSVDSKTVNALCTHEKPDVDTSLHL